MRNAPTRTREAHRLVAGDARSLRNQHAVPADRVDKARSPLRTGGPPDPCEHAGRQKALERRVLGIVGGQIGAMPERLA